MRFDKHSFSYLWMNAKRRSEEKELERANALGRHREADMQMKGYLNTFGGVLQLPLPDLPVHRRLHLAASLPFQGAADFQGALAKELRMEQLSTESNADITSEPSLRELLNLQTRKQAEEEYACVIVPLEDALKGPGRVAWKLIEDTKEQSTDSFVFNDEQILLIALCVWPLEQAWQAHMIKQQNVCATVDTLHKLPNDLGLPRIGATGGGGCGKTSDAKSCSAYSADLLP